MFHSDACCAAVISGSYRVFLRSIPRSSQILSTQTLAGILLKVHRVSLASYFVNILISGTFIEETTLLRAATCRSI